MGCSAAKNLTVEPLDSSNNGVSEVSNGHVEVARKVSIARSDFPPLEGEEPQAEVLESATVSNLQKGTNGMSFEIAFPEDGDESIIKKHPPKRFQRLEDEATTDPVESLIKLQEKLDEAEVRRQQILQQRIQSAKIKNTLKNQTSVTSSDNEVPEL